jgi:hypothetical protein
LTAVNIVIAASCRLGHARAFNHPAYKKLSKYKLAVDDGMITMVVPFIMSPFRVLTKPAKAFIKRALGFTTTSRDTKACLHLSVVAAQGTAQLAHMWSACSVLIIGDF